MEELKARILEIVEDYEEGISVLDNDMAQAGIDPKSDFVNTIVQLLEERECRAREEGFREGADIVESDYIRKVKKLEKRLSKLKEVK